MTTKQFRSLIIFSLVLAAAGGLLAFWSDEYLPPELVAYNQATYEAEITGAEALVFLMLIPLIVVMTWATIGFYQFKPLHRKMCLWLTVFTTPIYVLLGPVVATGLEEALLVSSSMLWGAALGVSYCPPVDDKFEKSS